MFINTTSNTTVVNSGFNQNTAVVYGGALDVVSASSVDLEDCRLVSNTASYGGAIYHRMNHQGFRMKGGLMMQNNASNNGGGLMGMGVDEVRYRLMLIMVSSVYCPS